MASDVFSILVSVGLMFFFMIAGFILSQAQPADAPWEQPEHPVPVRPRAPEPKRHQAAVPKTI